MGDYGRRGYGGGGGYGSRGGGRGFDRFDDRFVVAGERRAVVGGS